MEIHPDTGKFGIVALVGSGIYLAGVLTGEPDVVTGATGTTGEVFAPFRTIGGLLVIAAVAGWLASRLTTNPPY